MLKLIKESLDLYKDVRFTVEDSFYTVRFGNGDLLTYSDDFYELEEIVLNTLLYSNNPKPKCKYVRREGESCTLNNNCKYPNCE